jgi:hypothetical protein
VLRLPFITHIAYRHHQLSSSSSIIKIAITTTATSSHTVHPFTTSPHHHHFTHHFTTSPLHHFITSPPSSSTSIHHVNSVLGQALDGCQSTIDHRPHHYQHHRHLSQCHTTFKRYLVVGMG